VLILSVAKRRCASPPILRDERAFFLTKFRDDKLFRLSSTLSTRVSMPLIVPLILKRLRSVRLWQPSCSYPCGKAESTDEAGAQT
jgi:hypothetical protein